MSTRHSLNPDDADDSDSSTSSVSPVRIPRRSATVSPSTRNSFKGRPTRRRSDFNLHLEHERKQRSIRASRERSEGRERRKRLRKTNSEPNVESQGLDINALRQLLAQLPNLAVTTDTQIQMNAMSDSGGEDMLNTESEELRDAAKSIQCLQRVLKLPNQNSSDRGVFSDDDSGTVTSGQDGTRASGISTRFGHPRGVMQFIPSIRSEHFLTPSESSYRSRRSSISRKQSVPEGYLSFPEVGIEEDKSPRLRRRGVVDELYASNGMLERKGSESIAGVSRFSKLLKSFRSRPTSPDQGPTISWSPYTLCTEADGEGRAMDSSMLEADILLWKKRSRASLRRHDSARNLAARELFDTEKSFVEGLEFLVTKYMRPLRAPLECTLIEAGLVDKIFYRIPEILAHHQVLLAALSARIEAWHKDSAVGDILLGHPSVLENYQAFVDNFKYAKQAIGQARSKPSFEKYYTMLSRSSEQIGSGFPADFPNPTDPSVGLFPAKIEDLRYELLVKQLLKHTPAEHYDHECLIRAQRHIHNLAVGINQAKEATEQQEQRLREIEAIVDGLDDLVSSGRNLVRYDMVAMKGREGKKLRCVFMLSDQLILTSVKRKIPAKNGRMITQSPDFLDTNRFKLLIKISLDDVEIGKDTMSQLRETEGAIEAAKEDEKVIKKIIELSNLLRANKEKLVPILEEMEVENAKKLKGLNEQMTSNPDLTNVHLSVATANGMESVPLEFASAEKRAVWENAFREAKNSIVNQQLSAPPSKLKNVLAHQTRPGLQLCSAAVVPGKRADSCPAVWLCASDKFSGQVAVVSLDGNEPSIESCAGIGNSSIAAICTVPPPVKNRKRKIRSQKSLEHLSKHENFMDLNSSGSSSDSSSDEASGSGQTTVWIGNEDGDVYVLNSTERVRTRQRERVARLPNSVTAICHCGGEVYVATSTTSKPELLRFRPESERSWDLEKPQKVYHTLPGNISFMCQVGRRLVMPCGSSIHSYDTEMDDWQSSAPIVSPDDRLTIMCNAGATLFVTGKRSTTIHVLDAFSLQVLNHFGIAAVVRTQLNGREDILREHKMGCLRVSYLTAARSHLWIGTSAGFVISTPIHSAKSQPNPVLSVCDMAHSGPCRVLLPINVALTRKMKRMSLNVPIQQNSQLLVVSCGEGLDEKGANQDPSTDAVNHLIFWKST